MNKRSTHALCCAMAILAMTAWGCSSDEGGGAAAAGGNDAGGTIGDAAGTSDSGGSDGTNLDAGSTDTAVADSGGAKDSAASDSTTADTSSADAGNSGDTASNGNDTTTDSASSTDAASSTDVGSSSDTSSSADTATAEQWNTCDANADCAVFESECCDHCNGGKLIAVNKTHLDAAIKAFKKPADQCKGTACTEKGCGAAVAACEAGKCVGKPDPAFPFGCAKLGENDCDASKQCGTIWSYDVAAVCANKPTLPKTFQGCMKSDVGCGDALTCASKEGAKVIFPSTCLAEGWKAEQYDACCKSP